VIDCQATDNWIANYQAEQRQKQQQFLRAVKHEFLERTAQQRRDRLNQIQASQLQASQPQDHQVSLRVKG
jgi:hypothetical protein